MKMEEVRSIAKSHGISPGKFSKTELIKYIQANEGNFDWLCHRLRQGM